MAGKNTAVFGIYSSRLAADEAADNMRAAGFRGTDISVLIPENPGTKDLAHEKNTKAPEGVTTGVLLGGVTGGLLGWLTAAGMVALPYAGSALIAGGPIVGALAGAGAVGTLGCIIGALVGMGMPEYEARRFEGRIRKGGVLLSVHCDNRDWVKRAKDMLEQTGAQNIGAAGEKAGDFANADKPMPRVRTASAAGVLVPDEGTITERIVRRRPSPDAAVTEEPADLRSRGAAQRPGGGTE